MTVKEYEKRTGGNAFPTESHPGMNLREYFAAAALQGILAGGKMPNTEYAAEQALRYADALLKQCDKGLIRKLHEEVVMKGKR